MSNEKSTGNCQPDGYGHQVQPPPPSWAECPIEQKIERLRVEAVNDRHERRWILQRIVRCEQSLRKLDHHEHSKDGRVMVSITSVENQGDVAMRIEGNYDPFA